MELSREQEAALSKIKRFLTKTSGNEVGLFNWRTAQGIQDGLWQLINLSGFDKNLVYEALKQEGIEFTPIREQEAPVTQEEMEEMYNKIICILKEYLELPEDYYSLIAIWVMGTYAHESFETYPYLFFNAMRGSGKTRTLKLISTLGSKSDGSVLNNMTESVMFRIPRGTTTCIDELEGIGSKDKQTLRELLNSAYKKGMKVKRMKKVKDKDGESYVEDAFEPYFPLAMANIRGMDEVLGDRSISLILEKSDNPIFTKKVENFKTNENVPTLKNMLYRRLGVGWCSVGCPGNIDINNLWNFYINQKYCDTTTHTYTYIHNNIYTLTNTDLQAREKELEPYLELFNKIDESGISGRNFELAFPLLLVAKNVGPDVLSKIIKILKNIMAVKVEDEYTDSKDVSLYDFVARHGEIGKFHSVKDLANHFRLFVGDTGGEELWVNETWMGKALKRLNLVRLKKRLNDGIYVILDLDKAKEKLKIFKKEEKNDNPN